MQLPRGITGFRHMDDPPLPVSDHAAFRGHCYVAAQTLGGRVRSVEGPSQTSAANYTRAVIELPGRSIAILLNAHVPIIAFAVASRESGPLQFTDMPALAVLVQRFAAYEVWPASQLAAPLTPDSCKQLAEAELNQIKYWRPRSIGEVVFNVWD